MTKVVKWLEQETPYAQAIKNDPYHIARLNFLLSLYPDNPDTVVDFGCGEGFLSEYLVSNNLAKSLIGIDPSRKLINLAKKTNTENSTSSINYVEGGVGSLNTIRHSSVNLVIAANVLAYLDLEEEKEFYQQALRILKPKGHILISHYNELFDLVTLNNLTVDFHSKFFGWNSSAYIDMNGVEDVISYGIRENPLNYCNKLNDLGFNQVKLEFFHSHDAIPRSYEINVRNRISAQENLLITKDMSWKKYFLCGTFGVPAQKLV